MTFKRISPAVFKHLWASINGCALLLFCALSHSAPGQTVRCAEADLSKLSQRVYVSPNGNDGNGCGQSTTSPCKTIQQAIANCSGEGCGVLVRYGVYNTGVPVNLKDGVSLYGSCLFDETDYSYRSTIIGNPAIQASGINKPTLVQGFVILGGDAVHPGEVSTALVVSNSSGLIVRRDVLASGRGNNGSNGTTPVAGSGESGRYPPNDKTGGDSGRACYLNPPSGSTGKGGKGADFQQVYSSSCFPYVKPCCSNNNYPASVGQAGQNSGSVKGGDGGTRGSAGCACNGGGGNAGEGPGGANGQMGASSTVSGVANQDVKGGFAGTVWRPNAGGNGAPGQVGSGGGGGGSGGFAAIGGKDYPGFPGGGGGGGGCGGPGGTGAQQGGASIPLILFNSSVVGLTDSNVIIPGPGGRGGKGGDGSRGGLGAGGGNGYLGQQYDVEQGVNGVVCKGTVPGRGGKGGTGGQGGAGSGGAGGNGGPSFGIALVSSTSVSPSGITIYAGQPGSGGDLGLGGQNDAQNRGADGRAGNSGFSGSTIVSYTPTSLVTGTQP